MTIEVLKRGLLDTLQDGGRVGFERYGISRSGAVDPFALMAGNILVGNSWDEAAIEITVIGPVLRFNQDSVIALTGADLSPKINGRAAKTWESLFVAAESVLEFGERRLGCRCYLSVAGGFAIPKVMGSKSTNLQAGFGGLAGKPLCAGDKLPLTEAESDQSQLAGRVLPVAARPWYSDSPLVHVVLGPQDDYFTGGGLETFFSSTYQLDSASDRMGCRLKGPVIQHSGLPDIVSDGVTLGSIQIPSDGQPIVLLADHQTVGGYPKIATVITADLPLVAQCIPGKSTIRFRPISLEEAHTSYYRMYAALHQVHGI